MSGSLWDELDDLLNTYDADIEFSCSTASAWGGTLRLTLTDPPGAPSHSITFHTTGAAHPPRAARVLLDEAAKWLSESGVEPMPVPEWMRADDESEGGDD